MLENKNNLVPLKDLATQTIDYYDCVDYSNIIKQNEQNWQAYL